MQALIQELKAGSADHDTGTPASTLRQPAHNGRRIQATQDPGQIYLVNLEGVPEGLRQGAMRRP